MSAIDKLNQKIVNQLKLEFTIQINYCRWVIKERMRYQGGKSRISKQIADIINDVHGREITDGKTNCTPFNRGGAEAFVSLFCGTCSIESKVKGYDRIICNDIHEYLIALLQGVQNGYELPDTITEEQYRYIKAHKDEDKVLAGFVGIACSFGGKWFAGYAGNNSGRNYAREGKVSLLKDMQTLMDAEFTCKDYRDAELPDGCTVYADPPYFNTTGYNKQKFDSATFWDYMREISKSHTVYISEQTAPDDFVAIWEKPFRRTLDVNKSNQFVVTEKLFIPVGQKRYDLGA